MPAATQVFTSFLGGEISQVAQGRYDRQDYRMSMRTCINGIPIEAGAWTRRPGTQYAGHTRGGAQAKVDSFDIAQSAPITLEFTDGYLRFRSGAVLIPGNDPQAITTISTANPAVVQTAANHGWATGNTVYFNIPSTPLLQNRQFLITVIDPTHFSLRDALTGANIDGATLSYIHDSHTVVRVHELTTSYADGIWADVRVVQAEQQAVILHGTVAPHILSVTQEPTSLQQAAFSLDPAVFNDGPYFDPFTNGVQATASAVSGIIDLTLSFPAYDATKAYPKDAFVTSAGVNYVSLIDQNHGNLPAGSPSAWAATAANAAINDGRGFLGSDVGRLVRLLSEPDYWSKTTAYVTGNTVAYNPSGASGATTYWQAKQANTGKAPGTDLDNWSLIAQGAAVWTWGKITALSNIIDRALAGSVAIGNLTDGGGNNAAFDGNFSQPSTAAAWKGISQFDVYTPQTTFTMDQYIGKNYTAAGAQAIQHAIVYPASDVGFARGSYTIPSNAGYQFTVYMTMNLRAKATAPASPSDGTLLGTTGLMVPGNAPVSIYSNDQTTTWNYVWIEMSITFLEPVNSGLTRSYILNAAVSEVSFFGPTGTGTGAGVTMEILGPSLTYAGKPILTWRLGLYSDTTGYPTCGCWDSNGRLFLGGAVANRFDACVVGGISGDTINFAPTDQYGVVAASSAISYTFNAKGVNQIVWMIPEGQGIVMGTQAGEWLVTAPTNGPLAPNNIAAHRATKIGCANIEPVRTEHTTVFVKRFGRKLMEYFADVYSGKFSAPNLADKAQHITRNGVARLAYTEAVQPIVWGYCDDGTLFSVTYKRDALSTAQGPTFYAWARQQLGSGRSVESLCAGPSPGGNLDALTLVTNDSTTNIRHVEVMTDIPDETIPLTASWYCDDAVNPVTVTIVPLSTPTAADGGLSIHGLWHLNGKTVQVFAGGLDCGDPGEGNPISDFVVSNGSVFVPFGDGITAGPGRGQFTQAFAGSLPMSQILVGFTYNSDGRVVRLIAQADTGARNGPALGAPSRTHRATLKLVNAKGVSIGANFDELAPCLFKRNGKSATTLGVFETFYGIFYDQLKGDFDYEDSLCWRISRPFPATVTACAQNLRTEDM